MAKNTFWLVGEVGSGKTTVATALAAMYARRPGIVCAVLLEAGMVLRFNATTGHFDDDHHALDLLNSADFVFIEATPSRFNANMVRGGDHIVRLERVPHFKPNQTQADAVQGLDATGYVAGQGVAHA